MNANADVGRTNDKQTSALWYAACEGKEEAVRLLLASPDTQQCIDTRAASGHTPLSAAAADAHTAEPGLASIQHHLPGRRVAGHVARARRCGHSGRTLGRIQYDLELIAKPWPPAWCELCGIWIALGRPTPSVDRVPHVIDDVEGKV